MFACLFVVLCVVLSGVLVFFPNVGCVCLCFVWLLGLFSYFVLLDLLVGVCVMYDLLLVVCCVAWGLLLVFVSVLSVFCLCFLSLIEVLAGVCVVRCAELVFVFHVLLSCMCVCYACFELTWGSVLVLFLSDLLCCVMWCFGGCLFVLLFSPCSLHVGCCVCFC